MQLKHGKDFSLSAGPRDIFQNFTGPRVYKGWETLVNSVIEW